MRASDTQLLVDCFSTELSIDFTVIKNPKRAVIFHYWLSLNLVEGAKPNHRLRAIAFNNGREAGIRTRGTVLPVQLLSRQLPSAISATSPEYSLEFVCLEFGDPPTQPQKISFVLQRANSNLTLKNP